MTAPQEGPLDQAGIALAPTSHGAYRLWHEDKVLFVGMTSGARTLRSELMRHWRGDFGHTQKASRFEWLRPARRAGNRRCPARLMTRLERQPGAAGGTFAGATGGTPGSGGGKPGTT